MSVALDPTSIDDIDLLRGDWNAWLRLLSLRGEHSSPRMSYLDGVIQIMSPSPDHERIKSFIAALLEVWALETGNDLTPYGAWTLKDGRKKAGAEPDECYVVGAERKARPDLAIEVIWTSGGLGKLEIYRRLGVREVWTWKGGVLHVHVLRNRAYKPVERSELFPELDLDLMLSFLDRPTVTQAQREFLAAIRSSAHG